MKKKAELLLEKEKLLQTKDECALERELQVANKDAEINALKAQLLEVSGTITYTIIVRNK